jgi:RHS repeat-associated protein
LVNRYQYNGIELLDDWGLNLNTARYRTLDPQLGRWWQIDPEVEQFEAWSAYNSNLDNPIRYEDKDGDWVTNAIGGLVSAGVEYGSQVATNYLENRQNIFTDNIDEATLH